jgi:hypothetical protein
VIAVFVAFVAVPAVAAFRFATWVVLATVNGAVPVATVDVITPVADMVVNAPVFAVVAPTVPLILMDAVPVKLVTVPLLGVPRTPPFTTNDPADPTATPNAVATLAPRPVIEPTAGVTVVLPARVSCPWALTEKVPTWVAEPYEPDVTAVFAILNVVAGDRVSPVPAE